MDGPDGGESSRVFPGAWAPRTGKQKAMGVGLGLPREPSARGSRRAYVDDDRTRRDILWTSLPRKDTDTCPWASTPGMTTNHNGQAGGDIVTDGARRAGRGGYRGPQVRGGDT